MNSRPMRKLVGYRRLWLATAQIGLSSWMVQVALFAALVSHHSARVMAMVLLVATMPSLLAGPVFGAWLDGRARPELAAWAAGAQAVLLPVMAGLVVHHIILLTGVYAVYNLIGTLGATARQQLRYHLVPPGRWAEVNARLGGVTGITTIVGALLGGTVGLWGLTTVLFVSAAARLGSSILLGSLARGVRILNAASDTSSPDPDYALRDGFRALKRFPAAMSVLLVGIAWGVLGGSYDVLLSDYGVRLLHGGGWGLSGLYATDGLGVLLGAWVARQIRARWPPTPTVSRICCKAPSGPSLPSATHGRWPPPCSSPCGWPAASSLPGTPPCSWTRCPTDCIAAFSACIQPPTESSAARLWR